MLRTRLFLNLAPFVVILLAIGVYAIVLFSRLVEGVDLVVMKNYQSVVGMQTMEVALAKMQGGVLMAFENIEALGQQIFSENARLFETNLNAQLKSATPGQERALSQQLKSNYRSLHATGLRIFEETQKETCQQLYNTEFYPALARVTDQLRAIRDLNHQAILRTKDSAGQSVRDVTRLMILGLVIALLLASFACYRLGQSILSPIQSLTRATHEVALGNLQEPVPVESTDELGQLALSFNRMTTQLQEYRQSTSEHILRLHRTMEAALASFPDPIYVLNRAGQIAVRNPTATELSEELGTQDRLPPRLGEIAQRVLETGQDYRPNHFQAAIQLVVKGAPKFFLPRVVTMRDRQSALIGVAVVLYDITRFRLLDDAKSNLVATVSHELRSPLTSLRMALHLLTDPKLGTFNARQGELVVTAREDAERLLRILNDLLDLTRLEQGQTGLQLEEVAPAELIEKAVAQMQEATRAKNVSLQRAVESDLPKVKVDVQRFSHVFSNLISNALKYSPPSGTISLRATQLDNQSVQFSVADQGPGVPDEYQRRVFERFFRVPGQPKTGAGLGLSIAREIVLAHGGRIGVRSEPGHGSDFFFVLPCGSQEDSAGAD